jgi:hypothetical protein
MTTQITDIRSKFINKKTEREEVTLDGLLGVVKTMQAEGTLNTDVAALERDVAEAEASGDSEKLDAVRGRLAYLIRMGKTFAKFNTTAADWRPLRGWNWNDRRGPYAVLGGIKVPHAYTEITIEKGYSLEIGPDAERKGASPGHDDTCSLCGHRPIVWSFPLVCDVKRIIILSGSECVHMYVHAVIPSRLDAEEMHKAAKSDFNRQRTIKAANNKLDRKLAEAAGWSDGETFGDLVKNAERGESMPPHVEKRHATNALKAVVGIRKGSLRTKGEVEDSMRAIDALGFDATWKRVARSLRYATRKFPRPIPSPAVTAPVSASSAILTPEQIAIVGTSERFEILKALGEGDKDRKGYWNRSYRAVRDGWNISPKWTRAIQRSLDKEQATKTSPSPSAKPIATVPFREGDKVTIEGEVVDVEYFGHDRSRYEHYRVKVKSGRDVVVMFKSYNGSTPSRGARVRVSGKAGWVMDRRADGKPVFIALNGRKAVDVL